MFRLVINPESRNSIVTATKALLEPLQINDFDEPDDDLIMNALAPPDVHRFQLLSS